MKVAICLVGQYRIFDYTFPFWSNDANIQIDTYVSTWDISSDLRKYIYEDIDIINFTKDYPHGLILNSEKIDFFQKITESKIKKILPSSNVKIYNSKYQSRDNTTNMVFLMKSCIDMIGEAHYDYILIVRFDSVVNVKKNIGELKKDVIYHSGFYETADKLDYFNVNDIFWVGGGDIMKKFVKGIYPTIYLPHRHLAYYIYENKFKEEELPPNIVIRGPYRYANIPQLKKFIKENRNPFKDNKLFYGNEYRILSTYSEIGSENFK
jgi:hypothetical protein